MPCRFPDMSKQSVFHQLRQRVSEGLLGCDVLLTTTGALKLPALVFLVTYESFHLKVRMGS